MKRVLLSVAAAVGVATLGASALASSSGPGVEWTTTGTHNTGAWTLGYAFEALTNTAVTRLGHYDENGDGFSSGHEVGLWDAAGNLLATGTVTSGDTLDGHFRWVDIDPVALVKGATYVVGGATHSDSYSYWHDGFGVNPDIRYVEDRFVSGDPLTFPTSSSGYGGTSGQDNGWFGGNVWLGEIPSPGALALMGVAGFAARRRRRG